MRPDTDAEPAGLPGEDLAAQGESYARALLDRIGRGASSPDDLSDLLQFLHAGPMLHAACAVLFLAMRSVVRPEGQGGRDAR